MKRNKITEFVGKNELIEYKRRVAFHEAGHAAGIHLNNKARQLPPIFFKIIFKDMNGVTEADIRTYQTSHDDCIARVRGGRLIELLPHSFDNLVHKLTKNNDSVMPLIKDYMMAFETDVINLLIGPLAEAKHVADIDDELFSHQLIDLNALKNYGGNSDLALVNEYLQCLSVNKQQRDEKLAELFTIAFDFVNNDANWEAITKLADYILASSKNIICCEEIILMLDHSVDNYQGQRVRARNSYN